MRIAIYIVLTFVVFSAGWISHRIIKGEDTADYHWKRLNDYREHMNDPKNAGSSIGFTHVSVPFDETPHLEALVAAGELEKRAVLIPGLPVSRDNTKDWMEFAHHEDVISATAQGEYYNGEVPLAFTIWYRPTFDDELTEYIDKLKKKANKAEMATPRKPSD